MDTELDPERWDRVGALFAAALELPREARHGFVEREEADAALRAEVLSLLEAHERDDGPFATAFEADGDPLAEREAVPSRLGPYQLFHLLGRGGMGSVYLAARVDGEYRKRVALKILRPGLDSPELARRFRRERQILAVLDHPAIARLLDGGTIDGRPYLVLEYVEGRPLDRWCREEKPSLARRLALFEAICGAVAYAHQNLIVHRDLKPANILVTADGSPKLLDFGISKLLNPELSPLTLAPTALGLEPMTPDYASPEQLRGAPITTASDVFSLGVLLFELLADRHPFRRPGQTRAALLRRIDEEEPERPSAAARANETSDDRPAIAPRRLQGDLDAIVGKALRKEPHRRYASVAQLAEDLERYRAGAPVLAHKGTRGYRLRKWIGRHRIAVAAAATLVAVSLGFGALMASNARSLARERDAAERARQRAEQVKKLLIELFEVSDPDRATGATITAREVLDRGVERLARPLGDPPEVRADLLNTVGTIHRRLGLLASAEPLLARALALRQKAAGGAGDLAVAESLHAFGELRGDQGRYPEARGFYERALAIRRRENDGAREADTLTALGVVLRKLDRLPEAEATLERALELRRRTGPPGGLELAATENALAVVHAVGGRYDLARPLFEEVLAIRRRQLGPNRLEVGNAIENLALLEFAESDLEPAERHCRESLALRSRLLPAVHPSLAASYANLGEVLNQRGRYAEAAVWNRKAIEMRTRTNGPEHPLLALAYGSLGHSEAGLGHFEAARALHRKALDMSVRLEGEGSAAAASSLYSLADLLERTGRAAEARPLSARALALRQELLGAPHALTVESLLLEARIEVALGHPGAGERRAREALAAIEKERPNAWRERGEISSVLGIAIAAAGRRAEAEALLTEAVGTLERLGEGAKSLEEARERLRTFLGLGAQRRSERNAPYSARPSSSTARPIAYGAHDQCREVRCAGGRADGEGDGEADPVSPASVPSPSAGRPPSFASSPGSTTSTA